MNTYVMGEIATLLAISVLAGILIGWCIKSLLAGRNERRVRRHIARDVNEAMADAESLRSRLQRKEEALIAANEELQKMRGRDLSMKAGNTSQVDEINKLKNELAIARQSLDRNRTEFNAFRNDSQKEVQTLNNQLARFTAGGPVYDERMTEANETITALRTATRENDRVIDSLRARVQEGDSTVENLRSQLHSKELSVNEIEIAQKSADESVSKLNTALKETTAERDQLKRDYDITLNNKNSEISKLQVRLEQLSQSQSELKKTEAELEKTRRQVKENADRSQEQIAGLKQTITHKEAERAAYLKDQKRMLKELADLQTERAQLKAAADGEIQAVKLQQSKAQDELQTIKLQHTEAQRELQSVSALKTQVENKSAEVVALNDMLRNISNSRNDLQSRVKQLESQALQNNRQQTEQHASQKKVAELTEALHQRDTTIAKLKNDFEEVTQRRNELGLELGELQSRANKDKTAIKAESAEQITQLANTLRDRDQSFAKLRKDMDDMTISRDRLTAELQKLQTRGAELESFKSDMQTAVANRDSELQQRTRAYQKLQSEFDSLSKLRDDYEARIESLKGEVQQQALQLKAQEQNSRKEIDSLKPEISQLRAKLSQADSENQKINAELSDAAALRLALTEKESVIQKLQIDVQDAKLMGSGADQKSQTKIDSLTAALRERDEEIARLNTAMTDNRLGAKQSQSEINLLKQELESQGKLIKGLEEQSENTLDLNKKIAAQSTEIEELRARLYHDDPQVAQDSSAQTSELQALRSQLAQKDSAYQALKRQLETVKSSQTDNTEQENLNRQLQSRVAQLQGELNARDQQVQRLEADVQGFAQLKQERQSLNTEQTTQRATKTAAPAATGSGSSSAKPRVFVRPESRPTTESMAEVPGMGASGRVVYTRDGYRIKHLDGRDNLSLLPGISGKAEAELNKHGVSDFEQIVLWGKREVLHFAERSGIAPSQAESYNWPRLANEILKGTYRRAEYLESDSE